MYKRIRKLELFYFLVISISIASCGLNKAYIIALKIDTKQGYIEYLKKHPKSKYDGEIKQKIEVIQDREDWYSANNINTILSYDKYMSAHPSGKYILEAKNRRDILQKKLNEEIKEKKMESEWEKTVSEGTLMAYQSYVSKYPMSKYAVIARSNISRIFENEKAQLKSANDVSIPKLIVDSLEEKLWAKAQKINTIKSYKDYIAKYPNGAHVEQAEKTIIDLEVSIIMSGKHATLPAPQKSWTNETSVSTGIQITNKTKYIITVFYSGVSSYKIVLNPGSKQTITLTPGRYSVAAKASDQSVIPFAGSYNLDAGEYSESFYIKTELR